MKILGSAKIVVKTLRMKYFLVMNVGILYVTFVLMFVRIVGNIYVTDVIMTIKKNVNK